MIFMTEKIKERLELYQSKLTQTLAQMNILREQAAIYNNIINELNLILQEKEAKPRALPK